MKIKSMEIYIVISEKDLIKWVEQKYPQYNVLSIEQADGSVWDTNKKVYLNVEAKEQDSAVEND